MFRRLKKDLKALRDRFLLPTAARREARRDRRGVAELDPGPSAVVREGVEWLLRAQAESTTRDGGVARHYSLIDGWGPSYPETTGYIIPTLLERARMADDDDRLRSSARKMLDFLVGVQFPNGGMPGGTVGCDPWVPVTFNTGQILLGLAAGVETFGRSYREPTRRAGEWLVETQDEDGAWRRHPTPFASPGEKAYETHVAWGMFEAARVLDCPDFATAAMNNVRWALTHQRSNGWVDECCLSDPSRPLTHTLGYFLRGVIEAYRYSGEERFLEAALLTGRALAACLDEDGRLPGRLDANWRPAVEWVCLTGTSQISHCWLLLFDGTGDDSYRTAALRANRFVRRTIRIDSTPETRGGVKGSFPVGGEYGRYQYLNWACKFTIDANVAELRLGGQRRQRLHRPHEA